MSGPDRFTCEETFRRLDDFLDRELRAEERGLVERHLESCAVCAREFDFEAALLAELRAKLRRIRLPAGLLAEIRLRLDEDDEVRKSEAS